MLKKTSYKFELLDKLGTIIDRDKKVNQYWSDVLEAYKELGTNMKIKTNEELRGEPIFCNINILIGGETIFLSKLGGERGIQYWSSFKREWSIPRLTDI